MSAVDGEQDGRNSQNAVPPQNIMRWMACPLRQPLPVEEYSAVQPAARDGAEASACPPAMLRRCHAIARHAPRRYPSHQRCRPTAHICAIAHRSRPRYANAKRMGMRDRERLRDLSQPTRIAPQCAEGAQEERCRKRVRRAGEACACSVRHRHLTVRRCPPLKKTQKASAPLPVIASRPAKRHG